MLSNLLMENISLRDFVESLDSRTQKNTCTYEKILQEIFEQLEKIEGGVHIKNDMTDVVSLIEAQTFIEGVKVGGHLVKILE